MKKKMIIIPVIAALLLTACAQNNPEGNNESTASTSAEQGSTAQQSADTTPAADTSDEAENKPENNSEETFLIGLDNEGVSISDITLLTLSDGTEISGEELTADKLDKDNFGTAACEGFCYLAEPLGIAQNSLDNGSDFTAPDATGTIEMDEDRVFKRYNVGDKYGDLTVKKASVSFDSEAYNNECFGWDPMLKGKDIDFPGVFYKEQYVEFGGEVTLTGYIRVNESSDYFPELEGAIELVVDDKSNFLPVANPEMDWDENGGFYTKRVCTSLGMYGEDYAYFIDEYGPIYLGNIKDAAVDTSGLNAEYPHYNKVKVTVNNIKMPVYHELPANPSYIQGEIKELEVIS